MGNLTLLTNTSWKQSFGDKPRKQFASWSVPKEIRQFCKLEDGTKRKLNIRFEKKYKVDEIEYFTVSSGGEILFPKEFRDKIESIVSNNPNSYFIATVLDVEPTQQMNTNLFLWNPKKWTWTTLEQDIEQVDLTGHCSQRWSCGSTKSIQAGDRIFLLKVGTEPKGIIAAGFATSSPFAERHWSGEDKNALYIDVDFEVLLNPDKEPILTVDILNAGNLAKQNWQPQSSGTSVKSKLVDELEAVWFGFLATQKIRHNPFVPAVNDTQKTYTEGTPNQVSITKYERNPFARKKCLEYYGYTCVVCDFNFEKTYGQIGKYFIHVHHLTKVATVGQTYEIDPIKDLRPVCPNCHSIIHRQKIPLTIENVKHLIEKCTSR